MNSTKDAAKVTVGLDLGDKYSFFHFLGDDGEVLEEGRVRTTPKALKGRFGSLARVRIAMETGTHSPWVSRLLKECGHEVIVANSRQLRLIYDNPKKSDKVDAEYLARLARLDPKLLKPVAHRRESAQRALSALRARDSLVSARTKLINHVRGAVKSFGGRVARCSTPSFQDKAKEWIPEGLRSTMAPLLEMIGQLSSKIRDFDKAIERVCKEHHKETDRLRQVTGVGPLTALAYTLILEDPRRFKKSRTVGAFTGLTPRKDDSGEHEPQLRITKAGDQLLRRLLVNSAHYILGPFGPDCDLRRHGEKIAARGGKNARKRALVAVAWKLAVLLHRLWLSRQEYEPLRNTERRQRRAKGKKQAKPAALLN